MPKISSPQVILRSIAHYLPQSRRLDQVSPSSSPVTSPFLSTNPDPSQRMNPLRENELNLTRRQLFGRGALGLGTATMAQLLGSDLLAQTPASPEGLHHPAKAKRVIYLFMSGGPSHHDMWDYKPKMKDMAGKDLPKEVRNGQRITGMTSARKPSRSVLRNTNSRSTRTTRRASG